MSSRSITGIGVSSLTPGTSAPANGFGASFSFAPHEKNGRRLRQRMAIGGPEIGRYELVHERVHVGRRHSTGIGVDADFERPSPESAEGVAVHSRRGVRAVAAAEAPGEIVPPFLELGRKVSCCRHTVHAAKGGFKARV
jgi:hypothetical protein